MADVKEMFYKTLISNFHDDISQGKISGGKIGIIAKQYNNLSTMREWEESLIEASFVIRKEIANAQLLVQ